MEIFEHCTDCHTKKPVADSSYTLISSRYGWRLSRSFDAAGRRVLEWRCPSCWARHRQQSLATRAG